MKSHWKLRFLIPLCVIAVVAPLAFAQQTGSIAGRVTSDGVGLPGVTVEATSPGLPQARVTTTGMEGRYRLPQLPPGSYTVTFSLSGMRTESRQTLVPLNQETVINVVLGMAALEEEIVVTADAVLVDTTSTAIRSAVTEDIIEEVPVGQEYRDLLKLAPAVQLNDGASSRGPSAGGSEQDNVYEFDGVNVTLPLFGVLAAEPSTQDIQQVSIVKGGAKAVDFNRSAGFTIDSVSKSGTNEFAGEIEYQVQSDSMSSDVDGQTSSIFDEDRDWATLAIGGPLVRDMLFGYGSYYRPTRERSNASNAYGAVPGFDSERDEFFGKLTFTPTSNILLNGSYRDSDRENRNASIGAFESPSLSVGEDSTQTIAIVEGSWIVGDTSFFTFKYNDYGLETSERPDTLFPNVVPTFVPGESRLDLDNLDRLGYFSVPAYDPERPDYNDFIRPFVERYSYDPTTGGGAVGGASTINNQDFFRESWQIGYDFTLDLGATHDFHIGYQTYVDEEDLSRFSNGYGFITVPGGAPEDDLDGTPVFFRVTTQRSNFGSATGQVIHSEFESHNIEINDTITWNDWSFNVGVMLSNDILYGQGLREDPSTLSGYVSAPGNKYKMHEIDFDEQIQPRLGATWAYNGRDTLYAAYSRYNPAASSLPRAASWDRNTLGLVTESFYDANGVLIASQQLRGSSGKLFQAGIDPRYTDEFLLGTARQFQDGPAVRVYARYRKSANFWEDTNNTARVDERYAAPSWVPNELYIPDLDEKRDQIGSGSSYVIAQLDGAFTKYYEATIESDWRPSDNTFLRGTYTWSHYYGNFDQDSTSQTYDFATFIGSSNLADNIGRQIWDNKYGNLHGDRRHLLKLYGSYNLPWNATVGAFGLYQDGHAWEMWSYEPYSDRTGSRSDTNRYAEPAGSRRTDDHYQLDLSYIQNLPITSGITAQLVVDLFNVFDKQTGYAPQPAVHNPNFGQPRAQHPPRRFQVAARLQF